MTTPAFLVRLMHYARLVRVRMGPEDTEALAFATELRVATLNGRLRAVWTHPANELAWQPKTTPRIALARALGMIQGTPDYLFLWHGGSLAMEFKAKGGYQTDGQKAFEQWCNVVGVPYFVVRSTAQGLSILRDYGRLA